MTDLKAVDQQRIEALERRGYTRREAEFLCLAALHGGFFLRRQYVRFTDKAVGGTAATLIEKVLTKGHARATTYAGGVHIYHLCARPFYAAIGQENNRNRRLHQPSTIKARLMALDFVLAHPEGEYLATEREKIAYFKGDLGLDPVQLPSVRYVMRGNVSEHFFVEKFPIFLAPAAVSEHRTVPSFCFIDEGAAALAGFETFLRKYTPLFHALPSFRLIFTAGSEVHFEDAERVFARRFKASGAASTDPMMERLRRYFAARRLAEAQQWDTFNRSKRDHYREDKDHFAGVKFDELYTRWLTEGETSLRAVFTTKPSSGMAIQGYFSTCWLDENYELFSTAAA